MVLMDILVFMVYNNLLFYKTVTKQIQKKCLLKICKEKESALFLDKSKQNTFQSYVGIGIYLRKGRFLLFS